MKKLDSRVYSEFNSAAVRREIVVVRHISKMNF